MKKDRNCGVPYPIYQPYQGMPYMPNMMGPVPFDTGMPNMNMSTSTSSDQSINNLQEQITLLNKRVTNLETMLNSNNNVSQYSSSNYQMM